MSSKLNAYYFLSNIYPVIGGWWCGGGGLWEVLIPSVFFLLLVKWGDCLPITLITGIYK